MAMTQRLFTDTKTFAFGKVHEPFILKCTSGTSSHAIKYFAISVHWKANTTRLWFLNGLHI